MTLSPPQQSPLHSPFLFFSAVELVFILLLKAESPTVVATPSFAMLTARCIPPLAVQALFSPHDGKKYLALSFSFPPVKECIFRIGFSFLTSKVSVGLHKGSVRLLLEAFPSSPHGEEVNFLLFRMFVHFLLRAVLAPPFCVPRVSPGQKIGHVPRPLLPLRMKSHPSCPSLPPQGHHLDLPPFSRSFPYSDVSTLFTTRALSSS